MTHELPHIPTSEKHTNQARPVAASRPVSSASSKRLKNAHDTRPRKRGGGGGNGGGSDTGGQGPVWWKRIKAITKIFTLIAIWGGLALALVIGFFAYDMPDVRQIAQPERAPSIVVLADDGTAFARYGDLVGQRVGIHDVSPKLIQAIISIEDRRFYSHFGVDVIGLVRAAYRNARAGRVVEGGSTLTQQLAKNLFLTPDRTLRRKVQEMLLALWLEHTYDKEQILTAYINRVYLGAGTYGVDAAAQTYFGRSARNLDVRQAAMIAGLLRAPSAFSPSSSPEKAEARAKVVLRAMLDEEYITESEYKDALSSTPLPREKPTAIGDGRYFGDWIVSQVNGLLTSVPQDIVVSTTLDPILQRDAERSLDSVLSEDPRKGPTQGALVALAPDGAVRALVGGRDYDDSKFNRATQAKRQPGSSFKPFVYLAALSTGMTPDDVFVDEPIKVGKWNPQNYDDKYRGPVTARQALAESINTVAVRVLQRAGIAKAIKTARALGITSPLGDDLGLALGTNVVTPLEITGAYASIASGGHFVMPYAIKEIKNRQGQVIYRRQDYRAPVVADPSAVASLTDMMTDVIRSGTGKRAALDRPVAGKTGTSSDYRDAWFLGFTGNYTTGVWLGHDDNTPMKRVTGGGLPAQAWHSFMVAAESRVPAKNLVTYIPSPAAPETPSQGSDSGESSSAPTSDFLGNFIRSLTGEE